MAISSETINTICFGACKVGMLPPVKLQDITASQSCADRGKIGADIVRLSYEKCGWSGQYRKQKLIERYGADIRLPDMWEEIAQCRR